MSIMRTLLVFLKLPSFDVIGVDVKLQGLHKTDTRTLHRAISLFTNKNCDSKSDPNSKSRIEMASSSHENTEELGFEKSQESFHAWKQFWKDVAEKKDHNFFNSQDSEGINAQEKEMNIKKQASSVGVTGQSAAERRWILSMRHGERVDLTYGSWAPFCFDENGTYVRKDLNMPLVLPQRKGGAESFAKDTPLTRVGTLQAFLVGEGLRAAGMSLRHVYASPALRCVETAHQLLLGLKGDPSLKIKIEPCLFENKQWHTSNGMRPFMTPLELHKAGYNVDLNHTPYLEIDINTSETVEEFYKRNEFVVQSVYKDTAAEGGNVMFVGHATTLDIVVTALKRMQEGNPEYSGYEIAEFLNKVPYCALGAMRDDPIEVVPPPCPPCLNTSTGRFDWRLLLTINNK